LNETQAALEGLGELKEILVLPGPAADLKEAALREAAIHERRKYRESTGNQ
jgi:hypothetical protein